MESPKIRRVQGLAFANLRASGIASQHRARLPVFEHTRAILGAVDSFDVCVITGDTGCGKTSGVPHILARRAARSEQLPPRMVVTQPRRVAATSIASRVSDQISKDTLISEGLKNVRPRVNYALGGLVGYRVRFDERRSAQTRITFATDGLLIRECLMGASSGDDLFASYDYVIIDEAHERSVRIDQLLGLCRVALLSRNVNNHKSRFKLIIMSATIDLAALLDFFQGAGLSATHMHIEGRTFPVSHLYTRTAVEDFVEACANAVCQILTSTSEGDILVFLPGSDEILSLRRNLLEKLGAFNQFRKSVKMLNRLVKAVQSDEALRSSLLYTPQEHLKELLTNHFGLSDDDFTVAEFEQLLPILRHLAEEPSTSVQVETVSWLNPGSILGGEKCNLTCEVLDQIVEIFPLYAALSFEEQQKVFEPPPTPLHRKVIVSTNIAETSLTLPAVRFVVDSGKVKLKVGSSLQTTDVSAAMAKQRAGRAGRVAAGFTYHIMTQRAFQALEPHTAPEILRCELVDTVLEFKAMNGLLSKALNIDQPDLSDWPLPTAPPSSAVEGAVALLSSLGALLPGGKQLSPKGMQLSALPIPVMWGNLLLQSIHCGCVAEILTIIAMLSLDVVWFPPAEKSSEDLSRLWNIRKRLLLPDSDHIGMLNLYNAWDRTSDRTRFCHLIGVDHRHFQRAKQIRDQLKDVILSRKEYGVTSISSVLTFTSDQEDPRKAYNTIRLCLCRGLFVQLAVKRASDPTKHVEEGSTVYVCERTKAQVLIHPSSCFFAFQAKRPDVIVYSSLVSTSEVFARDVSAVDETVALEVLRESKRLHKI